MDSDNVNIIVNQIEFLSDVIDFNDVDEERKANVQNILKEILKVYADPFRIIVSFDIRKRMYFNLWRPIYSTDWSKEQCNSNFDSKIIAWL